MTKITALPCCSNDDPLRTNSKHTIISSHAIKNSNIKGTDTSIMVIITSQQFLFRNTPSLSNIKTHHGINTIYKNNWDNLPGISWQRSRRTNQYFLYNIWGYLSNVLSYYLVELNHPYTIYSIFTIRVTLGIRLPVNGFPSDFLLRTSMIRMVHLVLG